MTAHEETLAPPDATTEERDYYALEKKVYSAFAPFYDLVAAPLRNVRTEVARLADVGASSRVLDVATGTGSQARAFAARAGTVIGIDISDAMLRVASRKPSMSNLTFRKADATALPFADARFDLSCISFALHEMPLSVRRRVLAEMVRVTRPAGTIIIVDYGRPPGAGGAIFHAIVKLFERDHYVDFVRSDLPGLLDQAGIDVREDRPALWGAVRIVAGIRRGADRGSDRPSA
jgi:ubiquinone/menaquinone biosynthesis C-methylase UbiE